MLTSPRLFVTLLAVFSMQLVPAHARRGKEPLPNPDFTQGGGLPEAAKHDLTLGATGARGWMHSERLSTANARQIYITQVDAKSPADGVLKVGDVILGVAGKAFGSDARIEYAKALTEAEAESGALSLIRWRAGKREDVVVKMEVLGRYSATAPYHCPKSKLIFERGCEALAKRIKGSSYRAGAIPRSLNALALLASGERKYLPVIRQEAKWAQGYHADSMATWYYGYVIMFLAEYVMETGDQSAMEGLERLAMEAAEGQSIVGSWGHKFAGGDGRLVGYGMMNAPGVPLTTSLVMARAAGVKNPKLDLAIEGSAKLLRFYIGKGAVPYGDHAPWTQTHEGNGKCGMAAVLFKHLNEPEGAKYFSRMSLASHGAERETGHTGNFWNITWAMPAVAQLGPHASGGWMKEFGSWYYDLARRWDDQFQHQGPPAANPDKTKGWDASGSYLLAYAMPLEKLWLTGKGPGQLEPLSPEQAEEVIAAGRGWSNLDRNSAYDQLNMELLMDGLGSWSPTVRERCAMAIKRRGGVPVGTLIAMLDSPVIEERLGACAALGEMAGRAGKAVPLLTKTLDAEDLWLRVQAAEALAKIGGSAMSALPKMLETIAQGASEDDPRAMEQRYLMTIVFKQMLGKQSLDDVDHDLLYKAVRAGLQNEDGRARGAIGSVYDKLSYREIKPLLPAIHEAVVKPAPSGIMFADGIRGAGLKLLAKHRIAEGIPLCLELMDIQRWNKRSRITANLKVLESYGAAAKPMVPGLRQLANDLRAHREAKGLKEIADRAEALADQLAKGGGAKPLRSMKNL